MNKFLRILYLVPLSLLMTGCWTARIWTVVPTKEPVAPVTTVYTTKVTTPSPKVTTVTTFTVTNFSTDRCFYLDLNAVAAAFAESRTAAEFEQLLNSSKYMINNLDLNKDGWIDYLRVLETHRGVYHTFLIQACLAPSVYQDVATLVAEHRPSALYVEVIGDRWLYGPNYIVRPVFVKRPPMWDVFGRPSYAAWNSPYYYGYWPSYYQKPKPIYLNHYQAYVNTYMANHHYCHKCDYPSQPYYNGYVQMIQENSRRDYASQHSNDSFEQRITRQLTENGSGVTVRNAAQLQEAVSRQKSSSTTSRSSSSSSGVSSRTSGKTTTTSSRTSGTTGTATRNSESTASSSSTAARTSGTSSATRTSGTTGASTRSSGASSVTRSSGASSSATRTSSTTSASTRQPSTTVTTRVRKSGETRTTIKTTDENGRTQTVQRTSSTTSRTSTSRGTSTSRSSQGSSSGASPRSTQRGR